MYVCLCNGYRESELRELARRGFSDAEDAYLALGDGPCCGSCVDFAQTILDAERGQTGTAHGCDGVEEKAA
jgi:bacterioferritin-associated ferredoxin